jgi:multicomponent Na+:H+ antiporter subunit B
MNSLILRSATRLISLLLVVFSVFVLIRGHNAPGGGFIGGLLTTTAMALHMLAFGVHETYRLMRINPRVLIGVGIAASMASGSFALMAGRPFMAAVWMTTPVPGIGKVGTVLMFDLGVYLVVIGAALTIMLGLAEEAET